MTRSTEHVPIETVLCDREFNSQRVFQTLSNLGVNYLIPKRINSTEREVVETMEADGQAVAVESVSVHVEAENHSIQFLYVPSTKGNGTTVFRDESQSRSRRSRVVLPALQPPLVNRERIQVD